MDVVANYAAGEEAVGAFFSCEGRKGKPSVDDDEGPSRGPKKEKRRRKHDRSNGRTSTTISSPPWSAKGLEEPQRWLYLTKC